MRHRDTETQRIIGFLCVSVPLWPIALCLAGRVDFRHGLFAQFVLTRSAGRVHTPGLIPQIEGGS